MPCPSSIRCRDSNSQPLVHESPHITTRPGLPPDWATFYSTIWTHWTCVMKCLCNKIFPTTLYHLGARFHTESCCFISARAVDSILDFFDCEPTFFHSLHFFCWTLSIRCSFLFVNVFLCLLRTPTKVDLQFKFYMAFIFLCLSKYFFKKWANPGLIFRLFLVFSSKQYKFFNKSM